nr:DUF5808 domain-containing protein [Corynebacterium lactis]
MIFAIVMALSGLSIAAVMAVIPALNARTTPLGVSVPRSRVDDAAVTSAVRSYRRIVVGVGLVAALVAFGVAAAAPAAAWALAVASIAPTVVAVAGISTYVVTRKRIIAAKREGGWFDDSEVSVAARVSPDASAEGQRDLARVIAEVGRPRIPVAWYVAALALIGGAAAYVAARWADVPAVIVTHWGSGLEPDAWADKSVGQVFVPTWIGLGMVALLWACTLATSRLMIAVRGDRSIKGQLRSRAALAGMNRGFGVLAVLMAAGFALMQATSYLPGFERFVGATLGAFIVVTVLGSIAILIPVATAMTRVDDALRGISLPDDTTDSPDNDKFYKWGMFYYNPSDPAVLVEKRFGVGMDFNYATWQGKAFIVAVLATLVICVALPFLL